MERGGWSGKTIFRQTVRINAIPSKLGFCAENSDGTE